MNFLVTILLHTWQFNTRNTSDIIISQQNLCYKLLVVCRLKKKKKKVMSVVTQIKTNNRLTPNIYYENVRDVRLLI